MSCDMFSLFVLSWYADPRALPSFPTRRSSDPLGGERLQAGVQAVQSRLDAALERGVERSNGLGVVEQARRGRSEEHTSELQSQSNLVCRLLLEKKKKT